MKETESSPAAEPVAEDGGARGRVQALVLAVAIALGIYVCYRLTLPFLPALAWALALGVLFTPLHERLEAKLRRSNLAAVVSVIVVGLIVAVPGIFVCQRLIMESAKGAEILQQKVESSEWRRVVGAQPRFVPLADWIEQQVDLPGTVKALAAWLTAAAGSIVKGSVVQALGFCLTFYLLFYFLRDHREVLRSLRSLSPLSPAEMERVFGRVADTIYATIYGTLAVAAVQGLLGGLMFWWLGLPAPFLWGLVMGLLAVVPVLGAFVVWIPAALFLALFRRLRFVGVWFVNFATPLRRKKAVDSPSARSVVSIAERSRTGARCVAALFRRHSRAQTWSARSPVGRVAGALAAVSWSCGKNARPPADRGSGAGCGAMPLRSSLPRRVALPTAAIHPREMGSRSSAWRTSSPRDSSIARHFLSVACHGVLAAAPD